MRHTSWFERVPPSRLMRWGLTLMTNLMLLAGVALWGWPAGNVVVLFWIENVILGAKTLAQMLTARPEPKASDPTTAPAGRLAVAAFFCLHYGIFCVVHLSFALILAGQIGLVPTTLGLLVPAGLIALRYAVDLASNWWGTPAQRTATPRQIMMWPYPRIVVLHLTVLLGMFLVAVLPELPFGLPVAWLGALTPGAQVVALMVALKLLAELAIDGLGYKITLLGDRSAERR